MRKRMEDQDVAMHALQIRHVEELKSIQSRNAESENRTNIVITEQANQLQMYKAEMTQKNQTLRKLEDECSRLRIDGSQHESKIEAMNSEMTELHGAMASLHGEMSVLQRELDDAQMVASASSKSLESLQKTFSENFAELEALRKDKQESDREFAKLEQHLADTTATLKSLSYENKTRIEGLVAERENLQSTLLKKEVKLKQATATNQELNSHLGKLHADVMGIKQEYVRLEEESARRVELSAEETGKLREALQHAEELNTRTTKQMIEAREENASLAAELTAQKAKFENMASDSRKLMKRIDRVETEKQDILIELSNKAQVSKELQSSLDALQEKYAQAMEKVEKERHQYKELETNYRSKESEIRHLQNQMADKDEKNVALERQLNEEIKLKEHAIESNRTQQKESANRIVESSQKNSKLAGDLTSAQEEISTLRTKLEEALNRVRTCEMERDELKAKSAVANKRLQELEDTIEENHARLDASDAEIEELKAAVKSQTERSSAEKAELKEVHQRALQALKTSHQAAIEDMEAAASTMKKHSEVNLEKALAKAREGFQRQLEEIQAARQRENSDARNRLSTLGNAMEGLQKELREESSKNSSLTEEMAVLRELVENGGGEAEERLARVEKERAKEKQRLESSLSDTKEQLNGANEAIVQLQHQVSSLKEELSAERELKTSTQQALKKAKEKLRLSESSSESAVNEASSLKKQIKDVERRYASQIASKEEEIQRVSRRNEVLSEAVSRLTHMNSAGGTPSANGEASYGFVNRGGGVYAMSYDQHQQTLESSHARGGSDYHDSQRLSPIQGGPNSYTGRGGLDDDSSVYNAPNITAPPPEPSLRSHASTGTLRSASATVRTPTRADSAAARANSAHNLKSTYSQQPGGRNQQGNMDSYMSPRHAMSPRATPGSPLGRPVDDVSSSLLRVQKALESRRSNSTPRGGLRASASTSDVGGRSPRASMGESQRRDRSSPAGTRNGGAFTNSEANRPIRAEYDAAYAQSAQLVQQDELFSPSRKRDNTSRPMSPTIANRPPPNIEFDYGPDFSQHTGPLSSKSRVPQLDIGKGGKSTPKGKVSKSVAESEEQDAFDVDSSARCEDGLGGLSNRSGESTSSRDSAGSYSRKIRDAVELGRDNQFMSSADKKRAGSASAAMGGSHTDRSEISRHQKAEATKRVYSAPPEKVNLSRVIKASRKTSKD